MVGDHDTPGRSAEVDTVGRAGRAFSVSLAASRATLHSEGELKPPARSTANITEARMYRKASRFYARNHQFAPAAKGRRRERLQVPLSPSTSRPLLIRRRNLFLEEPELQSAVSRVYWGPVPRFSPSGSEDSWSPARPPSGPGEGAPSIGRRLRGRVTSAARGIGETTRRPQEGGQSTRHQGRAARPSRPSTS